MSLHTEYGVARDRFGYEVIVLVGTKEEAEGYMRSAESLAGPGASGLYMVTRQISDWEKV